ncbi:ribosome small subunit-dependent GTPase A [Solirubrobacter taibaiensis]|nr:ribosome small subunit-dependent GTPase A [Solirubrobacter taibaiensis]
MHSELTRARVLAQYRGHWLVALEAENRLVTARGRLTETPVTGDWVGVDEGGAIAHVFERSGTIVRRAPGERGGPVSAHVLAANVDLALVTEPLPDPKARRLERFAALAASGGVPVALVLTKADLDEAGYETAAALARRMGVADAVAVSAVTGEGMGVLRSLLTPGTTAVLLGASGTGKSTLVNALLGEERMKTNEVRASDRRGRHTTVTRELLTLPSGASLIDTPGIRVAGLWDGTGESFNDVDSLATECRFADCGHDTEPGCAVREALDPERIAAWRKLQRELAWVTDRRAAQRQRDEWHKQITRQMRKSG